MAVIIAGRYQRLYNTVRRVPDALMQSVSCLSTFDDIFSSANRLHCQSQLASIKPGVVPQKPKWKVPGSGKDADMSMAAVLVPLCTVNNQPSVLFTRRSTRLTGNKGEVSFPGGKVDSDDKDIAHTALRETHEEVGLAESSVEMWGRLGPLPSRAYEIAVFPVIGFCGELNIETLKVNHKEVDEVFTATFSSLCDVSNIRYTRFRGKVTDYSLPIYLQQTHKIWGLTALILHQALSIVASGLYHFDLSMT